MRISSSAAQSCDQSGLLENPTFPVGVRWDNRPVVDP